MRRGAILLGVLSLLPAFPLGEGQVPAVTAVDELIAVSLDVSTLAQDVPLLGSARYDIVIQDLSADNPQNRSDIYHVIRLEVEINATSRNGWNVILGPSYFAPSNGGDTWQTYAIVQALPTVRQPYLQFTLRAILQPSLGTVRVDEETVLARVEPFALMNADFQTAPPRLGPFESVTIPIHIENAGVYPDTYDITATGPPSWLVRAQARATLFPGEQRDIPVDVQTPASRVFVPQEVGVITVVIRSTTDPSVFFERSTVVNLEGFYFPEYWAPIILLGAVLAGSATTRFREGRRRRGKEQGQPEASEFTPAQAVLLRDLKKRDPARHRELVAAQRRIARARLRSWAGMHSRRETIERTMVERQHLQARGARAEERARLGEERAKAAALARQRAELERERDARRKTLQAQRKRAEDRARRAEAQRARLADPARRRAARAQRLRERKLRAELAKKQRILRITERKRRVETERRTRLLLRKKQEIERQKKRSQRRKRR
ncbi:MAG TPA: hypothetical protein VGR28_10935 [Candidatus Thermoplasmatota archaeon]|jgi:hypothetical protein|nr:hypothetical protein [Candidatus Thermoplasmatota archaeon]